MGISFKCKYCSGTGNSGQISAYRCIKCGGAGSIDVEDSGSELLYEFFEGYMDKETDEVWLIKQLKRLIIARRADQKKD